MKTPNEILLRVLKDYLSRFGQVHTEVVFSKIMPTKRRFRADFFLEPNVIVEVNGGQWVGGRHNRGGSYEKDLEKMNLAQANGFMYFQYTYEMLRRGAYNEIGEKLQKDKRKHTEDKAGASL